MLMLYLEKWGMGRDEEKECGMVIFLVVFEKWRRKGTVFSFFLLKEEGKIRKGRN